MRMPQGIRTVGACLVAGSVLAAWLVAASPAGATTLRRMDLPVLVAQADRIVHARAVEINVHWDATGTQILTDTAFEVLDQAKGDGPARLTVSMLGGRIDPVEISVAGTPTFRQGEEVVLFTTPRPDGMKNLVGFSQGVMRIRRDERTGAPLAISEVPVGVTLVGTVGGKPEVVQPNRREALLTVLFDEIRKLADQQQQGTGAAPGKRGMAVSPTPVAVPDGGRP